MTTYVEEKANQENEIRNHWFKEHKVTINQYKDITILDWKESGTMIYSVRYLFHGNYMYVSGDLGEAVFRFTEKAIPERIARYSLSYFYEKLRAFCDSREDFNQQKANEYLEEIKRQWDDEQYNYNTDAVSELRDIIADCNTHEEFSHRLASFDIYSLGDSAWEWVARIGSCTPLRVRAYLIGLQMATAN